jgi:hypothetical protein
MAMKNRFLALLLGFSLPFMAWAGLESGTYISDLVVTNPLSTDLASTGDDHMRLIKSTIKTTFPNISGAMNATHTELNFLVGSTSGTFTGTLTGMSGATTGTVEYYRVGGKVTLYIISTISGTSNSTAMTMTGLPAAVQPAHTQTLACTNIVNSGTTSLAGSCGVAAAITFGLATVSGSNVINSTTGFTNSGSKGLTAGWSITYEVS